MCYIVVTLYDSPRVLYEPKGKGRNTMNPMNDSFVLFMPYWIARVMHREKLSYTTVFNLSEMRKYYSVEDLAILYWMNNRNGIFAESSGMMEQYIWTSEQERAYIQTNLVPMEPIAMDAIISRLNADNEMNAELVQSADYTPFTIKVIADKAPVFVVIQNPANKPEHKYALTTELLKLLYAYTGYDNMANSPLFKGYLTRLALVNNVL